MTNEELAPLLSYAAAYSRSLWIKLYPKPDLNDLISIANLGIAKALRSFDPFKGVPLRAYITQRIKWSLGEFLREIYGNREGNSGEKQYRIRLRNYVSLDTINRKEYRENFAAGLDIKNKLNTIPSSHSSIVNSILEGYTERELRQQGCTRQKYRESVKFLKEIAESECFRKFDGTGSMRKMARR